VALRKHMVSGVVALSLATFAGSAWGAPLYVLEDHNSRVSFDAGSQAGTFDWIVDGTSHLVQQWFWFRIGNNPERSIDTLPLTGAFASDTNPFSDNRADALFLRYEDAAIKIEPTFILRGGNAGTNSSDLAEQIKITNKGASTITISFFQYADFDLNGTPFDDSVSIFAGNHVIQTEGPVVMSESVVAPLPSFFEAEFHPVTLAKLNDVFADNLSNNAFRANGNLTWAFQWNFTIQAGKSVLISKDKQVVPTPGSIALLGLAGAFVLRRKR